MKETRISPEHVTHIEIISGYKTDYIWCNEILGKKNFFGLTIRQWWEEGFYYKGRQESIFAEKFDTDIKGYIEIDGVIHYNPLLKVFSAGKCIYSKRYDSLETIREICDRDFPTISIILK